MTRTQEALRNAPTRRTVLGLAAAAALAPVALWGGTADAAASSRTVPLPDGLRPEGITSGPGSTFYVGSLADGRILTGDLKTGSVRVLLPGATGRSLRGLYWDRRTKLVWAVGNLGAAAHVWAVDDTSGQVVSDTLIPGGVFLNDLTLTRGKVYVTDSRVDRLAVIPLGAGGAPLGAGPSFVPLGGAWPAYDGTSINANGIRRLPNGDLVLNNSTVGGLWQVDRRTGVATAIPLSGVTLTSGDGLEIDGTILYDVRGEGTSTVTALRLTRTGDNYAARYLSTLADPTLDVPSTATFAVGSLWAVNARFGTPSPETAAYYVTRLPAR